MIGDCGCHQGPWWGITPPPRCAMHSGTYHIPDVSVIPWFTITTTDVPAPAHAPQGWECPRCKTINAPHAMTCHGRECGGAK